MRHLDFTRPKKNHTINKYQRYIQSYQFYEDTPQRKDYMKTYNAEYRKQHGEYIECDCGSVIKGTSFYHHVKSKKHNKLKI